MDEKPYQSKRKLMEMFRKGELTSVASSSKIRRSDSVKQVEESGSSGVGSSIVSSTEKNKQSNLVVIAAKQ